MTTALRRLCWRGEQNPAYSPTPDFFMNALSIWAIIPAAGSGSRLADKLQQPKQFLSYQERPLWWHAAWAVTRHPLVKGLVLAVPADELERTEQDLQRLEQSCSLGVPICVRVGGARRQDSVRLALAGIPRECGLILVHDAARPFASTALVERLLEPFAADGFVGDGVIPGLGLVDTVKRAGPDGFAEQTLDREHLRLIQTPQLFRADILRTAHERAEAEGWEVTDDAALLEKCGHRVLIVPGEEKNRKITRPEDLALLRENSDYQPRIGFGYDVHRFGGNRPLRLGGVEIPGQYTIWAHSDGDTLLHALIDAILGCIGAGDIGSHFPDNDQTWDNADSSLLLDKTLGLAAEAGLVLDNVDLTVVAQKPKLQPHALNIRRNVARLLALPEQRVNFKATTEEGLGFTGKLEGVKAMAAVCGHLVGGQAR